MSIDASVRARTLTPRKLPAALQLEDVELLTTTRTITIGNLPGYRTAVIPAGTTVEVIGASARTGLPRIRCRAYGVTDAIVDPASIGREDQPTHTAHSQSRWHSTPESGDGTPAPCESSTSSTSTTASACSDTSSASSDQPSSTGSSPRKKRRQKAPTTKTRAADSSPPDPVRRAT